MARQVRIQFPGAVYHVMARGDRTGDQKETTVPLDWISNQLKLGTRSTVSLVTGALAERGANHRKLAKQYKSILNGTHV